MSPREWWKVFKKEICAKFRDKWTLPKFGALPDVDIDEAKYDGWRQFTDRAKVMFKCRRCRNSWTSTWGQVIFHYRLTGQKGWKRGEVKMFLPGQACRRCNSSEIFERPSWYEEERVKVMQNLQKKIKEKLYTKGHRPRHLNTSQRAANMTGYHEARLCEGCKKGVCKQGKENRDHPYDNTQYDGYGGY